MTSIGSEILCRPNSSKILIEKRRMRQDASPSKSLLSNLRHWFAFFRRKGTYIFEIYKKVASKEKVSISATFFIFPHLLFYDIMKSRESEIYVKFHIYQISLPLNLMLENEGIFEFYKKSCAEIYVKFQIYQYILHHQTFDVGEWRYIWILQKSCVKNGISPTFFSGCVGTHFFSNVFALIRSTYYVGLIGAKHW